MKNLFLFYVSITLPFLAFVWLNKLNLVSANLNLFLFFSYVFIYRTFTDGYRLVSLGIIEKKDIWKMIIPGKRVDHFKALYWTL